MDKKTASVLSLLEGVVLRSSKLTPPKYLSDGFYVAGKWIDREDLWRQHLKATGFSVLGVGAFGIAVTSPALPGKIIKIAPNSADNWIKYARLCASLHKLALSEEAWAYFLRVYHVHTFCGVTFAVCERLNWQLLQLELCPEKADLVSKYGKQRAELNGYQEGCDDQFTVRAVRQILLDNKPESARNDLHKGNVMLRGEQLVITDPWS